MDTRDLHEKGLKLRREIFGEEAVEQRTKAFGAFGEPLQNMINAYAYGDIWSRPALPLKTKSLAAIAMTAAIGRANELRVHVNGALANGCTADEIRKTALMAHFVTRCTASGTRDSVGRARSLIHFSNSPSRSRGAFLRLLARLQCVVKK